MQQELVTKSIFNSKPSNYDNLELEIKKEQGEARKELLPNFISETNELLDLAFMLPKERKENFITKEKIRLMFFKLIRKQKKFKSPENIFGEIRYLAVFDKETCEIGKLQYLDMIGQTATFLTYYDRLNHNDDGKTKHWRDIYLFDYNSPQLEAMWNQYHKIHMNELTFTDMVRFLELGDFIKTKSSVKEDFGKELAKAEEHPVMKNIMIEYKIPEAEIKKTKKVLQKLHPANMAIIEEFESVKDAEAKVGISASTISNVLCGGFSARNYMEAGNFRWQYSTEPNKKYFIHSNLGEKGYKAFNSKNPEHKEEWDSLMSKATVEDILNWIDTLSK